MSKDIRLLVKSQKASALVLSCSALVLGISVFVGFLRFTEKLRTEQTLSKQLASTSLLLSKGRRDAALAKEQQEEIQIRKQDEQARAKDHQEELQRRILDEQIKDEKYYSDVPLVVSTLDSKGKLVGFGRLAEPGGSAQYSFVVKNGDGEAVVSGTITNQSGMLVFNDDYSTPDELRTNGEITHSKPNASRLRLDFVVTTGASEKYRVGDTFYAMFVLPSIGE